MASTIKPGLPSKPEQPPLDLEPAGDCVAVECCAFIQDNCVCSETSGCNLGDVLPTGLSRNLPERDVRLEDSALDVHNNCKGIKDGGCSSEAPSLISQQGASCTSKAIDSSTRSVIEEISTDQICRSNSERTEKQGVEQGVAVQASQSVRSRSSNQWNAFQKQHGHLGLSRKGLQELYKLMKSGSYKVVDEDLDAMRSGSDVGPWGESFSNQSSYFSLISVKQASKNSTSTFPEVPSAPKVVAPEKCIEHETSNSSKIPCKTKLSNNCKESLASENSALEEPIDTAEGSAGSSSTSNKEKVGNTAVNDEYLKITKRLNCEISKKELQEIKQEKEERRKIKESIQTSSSSHQNLNIEMLNLSLEFRPITSRLRRQPRERLPDNHDRLFKNFSDWHVVDPEKVSAAVPADSGVYEWGCKAQFGKKIVCFYLGKSRCLRTRIRKYVDTKRHKFTGSNNWAKQRFFEGLVDQGCSIYLRFRVTNPVPSEVVECWLLCQIDYGLNSSLNGGKRRVQMEDGSLFPPPYESLYPLQHS